MVALVTGCGKAVESEPQDDEYYDLEPACRRPLAAAWAPLESPWWDTPDEEKPHRGTWSQFIEATQLAAHVSRTCHNLAEVSRCAARFAWLPGATGGAQDGPGRAFTVCYGNDLRAVSVVMGTGFHRISKQYAFGLCEDARQIVYGEDIRMEDCVGPPTVHPGIVGTTLVGEQASWHGSGDTLPDPETPPDTGEPPPWLTDTDATPPRLESLDDPSLCAMHQTCESPYGTLTYVVGGYSGSFSTGAGEDPWKAPWRLPRGWLWLYDEQGIPRGACEGFWLGLRGRPTKPDGRSQPRRLHDIIVEPCPSGLGPARTMALDRCLLQAPEGPYTPGCFSPTDP